MTLFETDDPPGDLQTPEGLLALMELPGIGARRAIALAREFRSASSFANASPSAVAAVAGSAARSLAGAALRISPIVSETHVRLIGYFDHDFPKLLRDIPDAPAVLWSVGSMPSGPLVAVVGTREPSDWGRRTAREAAASAVETGFGVVSGLALGIDTAAHEGTLEALGKTWAVLGGGVTSPTPRSNERLADQIIASGGGLLAEVPPGTRPSAQTLVSRNRLQSGLARATVVVQSGIPSGTLHTARFTIEQGRRLVVTLPAGESSQDASFAGCRALADPEGCDPATLKAQGKVAELVRGRRPAADLVAHRRAELDEYFADLFSTSV